MGAGRPELFQSASWSFHDCEQLVRLSQALENATLNVTRLGVILRPASSVPMQSTYFRARISTPSKRIGVRSMGVKVSITGTLSMPRKAAVQLMESRTNARFNREVTYDVNYLVAARFDTDKARRAAQLGVTVISEGEMLDFIQQGAFPENNKPARPDNYPSNFRDDEIV